MPHTESAKKRLRQNETRRLANKARLTELKTLRKQVLRDHHDGKTAEVKEGYEKLSKRLDQAASAGVIHHNTAARSKSRLAMALAKPVVDLKTARVVKAKPAASDAKAKTAKPKADKAVAADKAAAVKAADKPAAAKKPKAVKAPKA